MTATVQHLTASEAPSSGYARGWNDCLAKCEAEREALVAERDSQTARAAAITLDASEIIEHMAFVIFSLYVLGRDGKHNGRSYVDIAADLKAAETVAEVRAALGLAPTTSAPGATP